MSTFLAIGMLDVGGKCVRRLPAAVQRAIADGDEWVALRKETQMVTQVCDMFGVRQDEFDVLYSAKSNAWAVQYTVAPSLTARPSGWLAGAYKDAPHPNFLAAAAGALAGAALAVTFAGLQPRVIRHHMDRGVNDVSFVPYKLADGVYGVTGSNSSSMAANLAPGDTPPEVEAKLLAPLQHVSYNGRHLDFVKLPDVLDDCDWLGQVCWFLIDAVRPLPNNLQEQLPRCADWVDVTPAQVCSVATEKDAGRAAFAGAMLGWHGGASALPRQWCEQLVLRKGRTSLTLIRFLNTLQTCLGVMK